MMSPEEEKLCEEISFHPSVGEALKQTTGAELHRLQGWDANNEIARPLDGVGSPVKEEDAPEARDSLQSELPSGYLAFWGDRNVLGQETELGVLKTNDPNDVVRAKGTNAPNYELSTDDIVTRLQSWGKLCSFTISGASHDWLALNFEFLPQNITEFVADIYDFCPDTVDQHFGCFGEAVEMMAEMGQEVPPAMFELMEGVDWTDEEEAGLVVLRRSLERDRYIFLWWD